MTKIGQFENAPWSSIGFVVPVPDFQISHEGAQGVMIECPAWHSDSTVLEWITKERGGHWVMAIWKITRCGVEEILPNPHQNKRGLWVYLVRRT